MLIAACLAATAATATTSWACPPPSPDRDRVVLTLVTPDGATIGADGALVVKRAGYGDDGWTVRTVQGAAVTVEVQPLADGLERWRLAGAADRELEIVDGAGAVVAHVQQRARARTAMPAPRVRRLTSTAQGHGMAPYGVPASSMVLDLVAAPPVGATTLVAELVSGDTASGWFVMPVTATRRFARETYAHKGCAPGPSPVMAGSALRFAWLDGSGRLSRFTRAVTVARARP